MVKVLVEVINEHTVNLVWAVSSQAIREMDPVKQVLQGRQRCRISTVIVDKVSSRKLHLGIGGVSSLKRFWICFWLKNYTRTHTHTHTHTLYEIVSFRPQFLLELNIKPGIEGPLYGKHVYVSVLIKQD